MVYDLKTSDPNPSFLHTSYSPHMIDANTVKVEISGVGLDYVKVILVDVPSTNLRQEVPFTVKDSSFLTVDISKIEIKSNYIFFLIMLEMIQEKPAWVPVGPFTRV